MNIKEVIIDSRKYYLNVDRAIEDGVLKDEFIQDFQEGDIFTHKSNYHSPLKVVIISNGVDKYVYGGRNGNPFKLYSDNPRTKEEVLDNLNKNFPIFVKHLDLSLNGQPPKESEL